MFQLAEQKPIELKEFLADYNQASWLGYNQPRILLIQLVSALQAET